MAKPSKEAVHAAEVLFQLHRVQKRRLDSLAKAYGLSQQQASTLWQLEPGRGTTMSELAERLMCDASNVTGIIDKLEARGLARRSQGEDRRVKELTLTEAGLSIREAIRAQMTQPPAWLLKLSRDDQKHLSEILGRVETILAKGGLE